jgi:RNA polymerase sigma-70 factor (ECF subfamily)
MVRTGGGRKILLDLLPCLRRFARRLARSDDRGDDLLQEACERMLRHVDTHLSVSIGPAWCYTVVRNTWIDVLRRGQRGQRNAETGAALFDRADVSATAPHDAPSAIDIWRAIDGLTDDHREVILLCAIEDLDHDEVAKILGVATGTVRSRLARARLALAKTLQMEDRP